MKFDAEDGFESYYYGRGVEVDLEKAAMWLF